MLRKCALVSSPPPYPPVQTLSSFAARGRRGVELAWWHANNFPQHRFADVFDDVIGNVRASGGLGDVADDCVRGAVDVRVLLKDTF